MDESKLRAELDNWESDYTQFIGYLVAYNGSLQIAHWLADTRSNEHKTLGDLYETMVDLVDKFAEVCMGKYGVIKVPADCKVKNISKAPVAAGLSLVTSIQRDLQSGEDEDLKNIAADMAIALNKAKYLLKE